MSNYDVLVIGGGPGGYVAAIRAAQLGFKTACVDAWLNAAGKPSLGGTCLNVGCIPSKALLDSSHHFEHVSKHVKDHGVIVGNVTLDLGTMLKRKDKVVQTLTLGIGGLLKKNKIDALAGVARLLSTTDVEVTAHSGEKSTLTARYILLASGSIPQPLKVAGVDNVNIVDNAGALNFTEVPARLGVIGAGVIGLELGSVWRRLGAQVVLLEALDTFLAAADRALADDAFKTFTKQGLDIRLGAKVTAAQVSNNQVQVTYEQGGQTHTETFDKLIVAVGRKPNTDALNCEAVGITRDARGAIVVDDNCRTHVPNIYAIGDCVRGPMLAHKASHEGVAVVERLAGQKPEVDFNTIPWVIYTWPEIAWVGQTEHELTAQGRAFKSGQFPMLASGRAKAMHETGGFVKVLTDANTDKLLGVHVFAANASELIAEAGLALNFHANGEDIALTVHAHPTLAEALHEAALAASGHGLHL